MSTSLLFDMFADKADVSKSIQKYIDNVLRLNIVDISDAVKSREWALDRIKSVINARSNAPKLYGPKPFLFYGSYIKGTKVKEVDEFDILVVLDCNTGVFTVGGNPIADGQGSADPNHRYDARFYDDDVSGISPNKILKWFKGVVKEALDPWGVKILREDGPSLPVYLKKVDLQLDLVPAGVFKRYSDSKIFYNISTGETDTWLKTMPEEDIKRVNEAAEDRDNFKNVIRIAKRIKDTHNFDVISFAIETALVSWALNKFWWSDDLDKNVRDALLHLAQVFEDGSIADPTDSNRNLLSASSGQLRSYAATLRSIEKELRACAELTSQQESDERVHRAFED